MPIIGQLALFLALLLLLLFGLASPGRRPFWIVLRMGGNACVREGGGTGGGKEDQPVDLVDSDEED